MCIIWIKIVFFKDLVTRFLRKAAPNLSQELSIYIPSKRLPVVEQKRMLAKQLADFLHVYRKDTEQMRITCSLQLDAEKKRNRTRLVDEAKFQTLVYNLSEAELEQLMSAYMKSVGSEASVYLGVSGGSGGGNTGVVTTSKPTDDDSSTITTAVANNDPFEFNTMKSSAATSTTTIESAAASTVEDDRRKSFYDRKLKRRVLNPVVRVNSTKSDLLKRRNNDENSTTSNGSSGQRTSGYFTDSTHTQQLFTPSRSRSRSSVSSTRSNSNKHKRGFKRNAGISGSGKMGGVKHGNNGMTLQPQRSIDYETLMRSIYLTNGRNRVKSGKSTSSTNRKRISSWCRGIF